MRKIPVVVIFAPTASGKTALMRELFSCRDSRFFFNGRAEVISADSMQVYRELNIGTAKPDLDFCAEIPHHLIDIADYKTQVSVADFVNLADKVAEEIFERGKLPVVCGGTGFYIRSFLLGLPKTPESNEKIRADLKNRLENEGKEALYAELQRVDSQSAAKIHPNDCYRILRALEVYYTAGVPRSDYSLSVSFREKFDFLPIILQPEREILYRRIEERVDEMFACGLKAEVSDLISKGAVSTDPGMQAIGYREWFVSEDEDEIRRMIKHNSCKYAKKQYTYIKDLPSCNVISYSGSEEDVLGVNEMIENFARARFTLD